MRVKFKIETTKIAGGPRNEGAGKRIARYEREGEKGSTDFPNMWSPLPPFLLLPLQSATIFTSSLSRIFEELGRAQVGKDKDYRSVHGTRAYYRTAPAYREVLFATISVGVGRETNSGGPIHLKLSHVSRGTNDNSVFHGRATRKRRW